MPPDFEVLINDLFDGAISNSDRVQLLQKLASTNIEKSQLASLKHRIDKALSPTQELQLSDDVYVRNRGVAYFLQGIVFQHGLDGLIDHDAAISNFKLAIEHHNNDAVLSLAYLYLGEGGKLEPNYTEAARLFRLVPKDKAYEALLGLKKELTHYKKSYSNLGVRYHLAMGLNQDLSAQQEELKELFSWDPLMLSILLLEDSSLFSQQKFAHLSQLVLANSNVTLFRLLPRLADIGALILDRCYLVHNRQNGASSPLFFKSELDEGASTALNKLLNIPTTSVEDFAWLSSWIKSKNKIVGLRLTDFLIKIKAGLKNEEGVYIENNASLYAVLLAIYQYNPRLLDAQEQQLLPSLEKLLEINPSRFPIPQEEKPTNHLCFCP